MQSLIIEPVFLIFPHLLTFLHYDGSSIGRISSGSRIGIRLLPGFYYVIWLGTFFIYFHLWLLRLLLLHSFLGFLSLVFLPTLGLLRLLFWWFFATGWSWIWSRFFLWLLFLITFISFLYLICIVDIFICITYFLV